MRHCDSTRWRAWFSGEEARKGGIAPGQYGDFTLLNYDYFAVAEARIRRIESVVTLAGGPVVYANGDDKHLAPPAWSPVERFGDHYSIPRND